MSDIRLINLLPGSSVQGISPASASPNVTGQSTPLPGNLTPGTLITGFIVNRDANGNPVLRTASGDIPFSTQFFLKIGSEVTIRVENIAGNLQAHILQVNGQPPEIAEQRSAFTGQPDVILGNTQPTPSNSGAGATAQTAAVLLSSSPNAISITATLVAPPHNSNKNALPVGTQLTFTVNGVDVAPDAAQSAPPSLQAATSNPAQYAAYARASQPNASPSQPAFGGLPPIAAANALPDTPQPGSTQPGAASVSGIAEDPDIGIAARPGQTLAATVIGVQPGGETVIRSAAGMLQLPPGFSLPIGSRISLTLNNLLLPEQQTTPGGLPLAEQPAPIGELAHSWGSLQQIVGLLTAHADALGLSAIPSALPWLPAANAATPAPNTPPPQTMSAGLMLFISALRGGDFRNWLGKDNIDWLTEQGHEALLKKASAEFSSLAKQYTEPMQPHQWQSLFFPVAVHGEVQQARLFVKRDRKQSSSSQDSAPDEDTRFVLEVDLTELGEMQMDGFVRRQSRNVQFDLIIRTMTPLPKDMQHDILTIYSATGELTGYTGNIVFQAVKEFPVHPMEEIMQHAAPDVVV